MNSAAAQTDASVARAVEKIVAEQRAQVAQNGRVAGRMQAMAAEIDAQAFEVEAAGGAAASLALLEDGDARQAALGHLPRRAHAGGARAQNDQVRARVAASIGAGF